MYRSPTMTLITKQDELTDFCHSLSSERFITVDTEFMRENTYWPILCLVQVAGTETEGAIDVMAPGIDLAPLFDLMKNKNILKVFHAARQDMEIFYHLMGALPAPIFDSQVAAMVCGFGDQVSYENLVSKLTKARIDKSSRFTDWSRRPLSEKQISYALSDVTHLRDAYRKLEKNLEKTGRAGWLDAEMDILTSPATYEADPMQAHKRIKTRGAKPRAMAILKELAAWRELEAQRRDMPRGRILRDDALVEIALHAPATAEALGRTRGLSERVANGNMGREIIEAIKRGQAVPDDELPKPQKRQEMPSGTGPVTELMKVLLKLKCEEQDVAQKLVASSSDIEKIAAFGEESGVNALEGWRFELFGRDALRIRTGELGLAIRGDKLVLLENPNGD